MAKFGSFIANVVTLSQEDPWERPMKDSIGNPQYEGGLGSEATFSSLASLVLKEGIDLWLLKDAGTSSCVPSLPTIRRTDAGDYKPIY